MDYKPLTIFGQMVVDHVVHVKHPYESANLRGKAIDWDPITGRIIVNKNAVISTPYIVPPNAMRLCFPLKAGEYKSGDKIDALKAGEYKTGDKIDAAGVSVVGWGEDAELYRESNLSQLGFVREVPGGGGTNVSYALHIIFGNIQKRYISVYSKHQDNRMEDALVPLFAPGGLILLKEDPRPAVNIIIEGIAGDRFIIRSPRERNISMPYQEASGNVCMVNTCYNWYTALNGLIEALKAKEGGVIACTAALCDDKQIPQETGAKLAEIAKDKLGDYMQPTVTSIHSFIRDVVMKRADNLVYIFNEAELANFVKETRYQLDVLDLDKDAIFSGIVRALLWLRGIQAGVKPEMIVTLGMHGALYLDKNDNLHYCRVMTDREMQRIAGEKNAIGDLFAATVLGIYYSRGQRGVVPIVTPNSSGSKIAESYVPSVLIAASAAADDGVYNGFMEVTPRLISSLIETKVTHYSFLGSIHEIDPGNYAGKVGVVFERKLEGLQKGVIKDPCALSQLVDRNLLTS